MIDYQDVLEIHRVLIQNFGGLQGIRDANALQSALDRPFSGFGEMMFYPNPEEKAAAILESIVKNHPFADGNKRTGYVLMRLLLMHFHKDIQATQAEKYDLVIGVASGQLHFKDIVLWIKERIVSKKDLFY